MGEEIQKPLSAIVVPIPATAEANVCNEPAAGIELTLPPPKKKRNLPGMPVDPDAEVIALSPKTLLATNRFVCEVCNKGFQRDQNLQLHRRGHKLPWDLRQRTNNKEIKKKVYVCPEPTCVHHHRSRALGDLTGIKKHFCRKHGEKKWKCERCSKKYAVQSDWKAHMKTCGTREYRCVCGNLFSRKDSFITHRAFCDALAMETAKSQPQILPAVSSDGGSLTVEVGAAAQKTLASPPPPLTPSNGVVSPVLSVQSSELSEIQTGLSQQHSLTANNLATAAAVATSSTAPSGSSTSSGKVSSSNGVFASIFASPAAAPSAAEVSQSAQSPSSFTSLLCAMTGSDRAILEPMSLSLSRSSALYYSNKASHLFPTTEPEIPHYTPPIQAALSATALLQKAAQMGATTSNSSFLRGLGLTMSSPSDHHDHHSTTTTAAITTRWGDSHAQPAERNSGASGIGLGIRSNDLMMGSSTLLASEPTTLDLLGLGDLGAGGEASSGLSALISIGCGFDVSAAASFGGVKSGGSEA